MVNENTTNQSLIFGDFDKDGTPNVDDKYPFDKTRTDRVQEVSLSDELTKIKRHNLEFKSLLKKIKRRYGSRFKIRYRIKGTYSTIGKLRRQHIGKIKDILGVMVLCKNKEEIDNVARDIRSHYHVISDQDYYGYGKRGNKYYKARHVTVSINHKPVELQLKTSGHYALHLKTHPIYKKYGKIPKNQYQELLRTSKEIERREG